VPPRRYDLAAELLAEAVQRAVRTGSDVAALLAEVGRERGQALAQAVRSRRPRAGKAALLRAVAEELGQHGYEPAVEGQEVVLRNCPFDALAERHRELVCGLNLDLLQGLVEGLDDTRLHARLEPAEGCCCVRVAAVQRWGALEEPGGAGRS
jgi:predicted ArsR family transcriptional regulator